MLSRRFFLKIGAGLVAFVPAAKALANPKQKYQVSLPLISFSGASETLNVPQPPPANWNSDFIIENYIDGTIVDISQNQIFVDERERGLMTLDISPDTLFWKGAYSRANDSNRFQLKVGDHIEGWGQPQANDHTVNIEKIWSNIVDVKGSMKNLVPSISTASLDFKERQGETYHVLIDELTEIIMPSGMSSSMANLASTNMEEEYYGQVIGLKQDDGSILATRVFIDASAQEVANHVHQESYPVNATPDAIQATFYVGHMARYTLCNGSNGACPSHCNNSSSHIAWTKLSTTGCNYCCYCSLPSLACNTQVWVRNDCIPANAYYGEIRDCSTMSSGGCPTNSYCSGTLWSGRPALLEVTGGFYSLLGGLITDGRTPVTIYA